MIRCVNVFLSWGGTSTHYSWHTEVVFSSVLCLPPNTLYFFISEQCFHLKLLICWKNIKSCRVVLFVFSSNLLFQNILRHFSRLLHCRDRRASRWLVWESNHQIEAHSVTSTEFAPHPAEIQGQSSLPSLSSRNQQLIVISSVLLNTKCPFVSWLVTPAAISRPSTSKKMDWICINTR